MYVHHLNIPIRFQCRHIGLLFSTRLRNGFSQLRFLTDIRVLALRMKPDDATRRFVRSAEVFGYTYDELDLSGRVNHLNDVPPFHKMSAIKGLLDKLEGQLETKYTLVVSA